MTLRLEVQLAQLKTDNAKLSGSYQALLSIRNQLSEENVKIRSSNKDLLKEREDLLEKTEALSKESINLTALLHAAKVAAASTDNLVLHCTTCYFMVLYRMSCVRLLKCVKDRRRSWRDAVSRFFLHKGFKQI